MGILYCGDCLDITEQRLEPESVDLIYADPPFFSNKYYEVIWGDEGEIRSFEDRWEGGVEVYAEWMADRLRACHRVLKKTGSIYLHCDWHASHHLRLRLDSIFGRANFRNEIIWSYKRYTASANRFQRLHDTIFFYGKTDKVTFNEVREGYGAKSGKADSHYKQDEDGRWYRWQKRKGQAPYKIYLSEGRRLGDVWEIPHINASARERLGYPTQKPEALLDRIITTSSHAGDLVLDPFCGCGTTMAVAQMLGRQWIGIDISPTAIRIIKQRLAKVGAGPIEVINMPIELAELRKLKPFEFQNWVIRERFNGTVGPRGGDKGVDGYTFMLHEPIQVKQSGHVGRNVVDNFVAAMRRNKKQRGFIVAFSFGKGAHEEAAALKRRDGLDIVLLTVDDLLRKPPT